MLISNFPVQLELRHRLKSWNFLFLKRARWENCSGGIAARANGMKSEDYAAKLVVNVTDINDKIYVAAREAGERSAGFARADDPGLPRGHRSPRPRQARCGAACNRDDRRDRCADRRPGRGGPRLRVRRRRLLPGAQLRGLRQALQPSHRGHGSGRGGRFGVAQGRPARLRAVEGAQARRGHLLGLALGTAGALPGTSSAR